MPLEKVCILLNKNCEKYILDHVRIDGFKLLDHVFITQLGYIYSKYQEICITIYQLLKNSVLYPIYLILLKN